MRIYIHTCVYTFIIAYIHSYMRIYIHTCVYTFIHAYIHTYIRIYIHTFIHITRARVCDPPSSGDERGG